MFANLIIGIIFNAISAALAPRPEKPEPEQEVQGPETEEGAEIGKVYGTVWIRDPRIHWFGDLRARPIKESQSKK